VRQLIDFKIPTYSVDQTGKKPEKMFFTPDFPKPNSDCLKNQQGMDLSQEHFALKSWPFPSERIIKMAACDILGPKLLRIQQAQRMLGIYTYRQLKLLKECDK
jgi:hypothetical protein